jgi:NAD(P)-dependent dehydrogenase (short-subunit alcohol dehydrogenase family)
MDKIHTITQLLNDILSSDDKLSREQINKLSPLLGNLKRKIVDDTINLNKDEDDIKSNLHKTCYICKINISKGTKRHKTYISMCWKCGDINLKYRDVKCDLSGKIAIVTGARLKIGFETAIRLLRNNCKVIVTTRFVDDCLERYQKDPDYTTFKDRLFIYQLDMMHSTQISKFIEYVTKSFPRIDYLINNAAQTIKRPPIFYEHLIKTNQITDSEQEMKQIIKKPKIIHDDDVRIVHKDEFKLSIDQSEIDRSLFPVGEYDQFGQQLDLRTSNSWILEADEVNIMELAETYIINTIAPYILATKLKPMMDRKDKEYSWIVNVTSMEGVFSWKCKSSKHPHTNMAKAALNMFTRTCGKYYIKSNIVMICIDTGWNNHQGPLSYDEQTPLDCGDGAARILYPLYKQIKRHSVLYKDFRCREW